MKKQMTMLAAAISLAAAAAGCVALQTDRAQAEEVRTALFLPTSYEQYLPLLSPSDAAIGENHIAIADGSKLYLFDREKESYLSYSHTAENGEERRISKIQFTPDGRLYYSDQDSHLFLYDFATGTARIQNNIPSATFVIDGSTLYTAAVTNNSTTFYSIPCSSANLSFADAKVIDGLNTPSGIAPHMFVKDGTLYCAINSYVHAYTLSSGEYEHRETLLAGGSPVQNLTSVAVYGDEVFYTVNGASLADGLYRAELGQSSELVLEGDGFRALTTYGDSLFAVKGATVRELKRGESDENGKSEISYTGYEIAADSDSPNRLAGATESVRAKDLVVTADCGNRRVSVYDRKENDFITIDCAADRVATDGETVAASAGNSISLYDYAAYRAAFLAGEPYEPYRFTTANHVLGLAVVFGRCYYVTEHHYGVAEEDAREFTRSNSPTALTADVYGNLYVADQQFRVTKYTEEEFLDEQQSGTPVTETWQLPAGFASLRADYEGSLYYLVGNTLYRNDAQIASFDARNCVYSEETGTPALSSFALGFEDNGLYLQYGNFMLYTEAVSFPALNTIAADGVREEIFSSPEAKSLSFADVAEGATGIGTELENLTEFSPYFPYAGYRRTEGGRGILLAEKGKFRLVALYENYDYSILLFRAEDCELSPIERTELPAAVRYTSNEIAFSYYPALAPALTAERLPRSTELTLLGTVTADRDEGFDYAFVRRGALYGYVPLPYLTMSEPDPSAPDEYELGFLGASETGVLFHAVGGGTLLVKDRRQVKIYDTNDGLFLVSFIKDGVEYTAQVTPGMLEKGSADGLRTGLIIVLSVVAVGIVAAYVLFVPRKKKNGK